MSDHECVVALALGAHRVADDLTSTSHLDQGVSIRIVRRNALDVDRGAGVDHRLEVLAQAVPVRFAVFVVYVALVPDAHVQLPYEDPRPGRVRSENHLQFARPIGPRRLPAYVEALKLTQLRWPSRAVCGGRS